MLSAPDTQAIDLATFPSSIDLPYTLTPGKAAGTFLAEIGTRRILGTRFVNGEVVAPAQDFSTRDAEDRYEFVEAPHTGVLGAFTQVGDDIIGLIQLDGCDNEFPHRVLADFATLTSGQRVAAVWDEVAEHSILCIAGFAPAPDAPLGVVTAFGETAAPLESIAYRMKLDYEHAYGPYYGRMFDEIRENGLIMGVRTSNGDDALLPPREIDDLTHLRTGTWKVCENTGTIRGCSIINMEFIGQTRPPPYVYAEIKLDGASTRLIHMIEIESIAWAKENVRPGRRVRAIWTTGERTGSLRDIERFELIDE
jgi:uncharacterized OB-fold protein